MCSGEEWKLRVCRSSSSLNGRDKVDDGLTELHSRFCNLSGLACSSSQAPSAHSPSCDWLSGLQERGLVDISSANINLLTFIVQELG